MNDEFYSNEAPAVRTRDPNSHAVRGNGVIHSTEQNGSPQFGAADFWPLIETVIHRWYWLALGGMVLGLVGLLCGLGLWKSSYVAPAQLMRYNSPNAAEIFGNREAAAQTFVSLLRAPDLLRQVGEKADPPISAESLAATLRVMPERNSDIIVVAVSGDNPQVAVDLVNLYAREAVRFTQQMQAQTAGEIGQFLGQQITERDQQIASLNLQTSNFSPAEVALTTAPRASVLAEKLQGAREELVDLLTRYTDAHPQVIAQHGKITLLEEQLSGAPLVGGSSNLLGSGDPLIVRSKLQSLENGRLTLLARQHAVKSFAENPPGYCQMLAPATLKDVVKQGRRVKVLFLAAFMGLIGIVSAAGVVVCHELADDRLKSGADLRRISRLPVLAFAGDFNKATEAEKENWAFRTWTNLKGRLSPSSNHGLVCGVTSAGHGEGRTTWISMLAQVASQQGFRVLTIATRPASQNGNGYHTTSESTRPDDDAPANSVALAPNVLATPMEVTQKLTAADSQPLVHIPLPGWVWNLERRKQWQAALQHWSQIENIVILVELPPASDPEAVLLAENLPNLLWLADAGKSTAGETCEQLETLRHARCRLAGAVLNHAPVSRLQNRYRRWLPTLSYQAH